MSATKTHISLHKALNVYTVHIVYDVLFVFFVTLCTIYIYMYGIQQQMCTTYVMYLCCVRRKHCITNAQVRFCVQCVQSMQW